MVAFSSRQDTACARPALCPMAYLYAFHFYGRIVSAAGESLAGPSVRDFKAEIRNAKKLWPTYRREVLRLDRKIWPSEPPVSLVAILALRDAAKSRTWYVHNVSAGLICEAEPPDEIPADYPLDELINYVAQNAHPEETVTIGVLGVAVKAKEGAEWIPEQSVLVPHDPED
jgi:hypothetical protein